MIPFPSPRLTPINVSRERGIEISLSLHDYSRFHSTFSFYYYFEPRSQRMRISKGLNMYNTWSSFIFERSSIDREEFRIFSVYDPRKSRSHAKTQRRHCLPSGAGEGKRNHPGLRTPWEVRISTGEREKERRNKGRERERGVGGKRRNTRRGGSLINEEAKQLAPTC